MNNSCEVKPRQNLANDIRRKMMKNNRRLLEQVTKTYILDQLLQSEISKEVNSFSEGHLEDFKIAPIEQSRFDAALQMTVTHSLSLDFDPPDGVTSFGKMKVSFDSKSLEKSFAYYATSSFRRENIRKYLGADLELLLPRKADEDRNDKYELEIDLQFGYLEGTAQVITFSNSRNDRNWLLQVIEKDLQKLISRINVEFKLMELAA